MGLFPSPPPLPPFHLHPDGRPFHSANTQTDTDTNSGIGRKNYSIHSRFTSRNFTRRKCLSHEAKRSLCNRKCVGDCECCSCIPGMFSYYTHFGNKKKTFLSLANNSPEKRREADSVLYIAIGPLSLPLAYIQHTQRDTHAHALTNSFEKLLPVSATCRSLAAAFTIVRIGRNTILVFLCIYDTSICRKLRYSILNKKRLMHLQCCSTTYEHPKPSNMLYIMCVVFVCTFGLFKMFRSAP